MEGYQTNGHIFFDFSNFVEASIFTHTNLPLFVLLHNLWKYLRNGGWRLLRIYIIFTTKIVSQKTHILSPGIKKKWVKKPVGFSILDLLLAGSSRVAAKKTKRFIAFTVSSKKIKMQLTKSF